VRPPKGGTGSSEESEPSHDTVDQHLEARIPVNAGPHALGVAFLKKPTELAESSRQPYQARFNSYRHPRLRPRAAEGGRRRERDDSGRRRRDARLRRSTATGGRYAAAW
jgi:hypothetical protein